MPGCHWLSRNYSVPTLCICTPALTCAHWALHFQPADSKHLQAGSATQVSCCNAQPWGKDFSLKIKYPLWEHPWGWGMLTIIWPLFQQRCDVTDLRPQACLSRWTESASVGSRGQLFSSSSFYFFVIWSDISKEIRPMFLSQAFGTSALRILLCNWVTVALKEVVTGIRPSLPLAGKIT